MPVSAATEKKLREAMARLLAGEPLHTDGALTRRTWHERQRSATPPSTAPRRSWPSGTPGSRVLCSVHPEKSNATRPSPTCASGYGRPPPGQPNCRARSTRSPR